MSKDIFAVSSNATRFDISFKKESETKLDVFIRDKGVLAGITKNNRQTAYAINKVGTFDIIPIELNCLLPALFIPTVSIDHLSLETRDHIVSMRAGVWETIAVSENGLFIQISKDPGDNSPEDLRELRAWARGSGFSWVFLTKKAPLVPFLQNYS